MISIAENRDCLEAMREYPDKYFDLAVVDPPYGDACSQSVQVERESRGRSTTGSAGGGKSTKWSRFGQRFDRYKENRSLALQPTQGRERERERERDVGPARTGGTLAEKYGKKIIAWDTAPGKEYFDELFRVSRNQIIWGGNYFDLPPTRCFLIWEKLSITENFSMAMAEYAWTSFFDNAKIFKAPPQGTKGDQRFHPTQKPVDLYRWIFSRYAKPGMKILDTHLGSGSSRIAAYDAGLHFWGYEIDKTYYDLQEKRFADYTAQQDLFHPVQGGDGQQMDISDLEGWPFG